MKRLALTLALGAALLLPGVARAGMAFGVTEDAGKYANDGGVTFFSRLRDLGMTESAVSVRWNPDRPTVIEERAFLDRFVANASRSGIRVVFAVYFTRPNAITATPRGEALFTSFLRSLARAYPHVKDFVVGNEPNYGPFWQPQFSPDGTRAAGAAYESVLARAYDTLKAVDRRIVVVGMGLAARGNDSPSAPAPSTSPIRFLHDVGAAYRRSGRARPLMDAFAYHPYPASSLDGAATSQTWPQAGVADLARVKQAVWDAFRGTAQPTFEQGLPLKITEVGWEATIPGVHRSAYHGAETVRTTDEATQARVYARLVRSLACDPSVTDLLFFHLIDESHLGGFQSGLIRAGGSLRPAYSAVRAAIADTRGRCTGTPVAWRHTETVVGGGVEFSLPTAGAAPAFTATAQEDVTYRAALVRVDRAGDAARLATDGMATSSKAVPLADGEIAAYVKAQPQNPSVSVEPGTYVEAVLLSATTNPARSSLFVSRPFALGAAPKATEEVGAPAQAPTVASDPLTFSLGGSDSAPPPPQYIVDALASEAPEQLPAGVGVARTTVRRRSAAPARAPAGPDKAAFTKLPAQPLAGTRSAARATMDREVESAAAAASAAAPYVAPQQRNALLALLPGLLVVTAVAVGVVAVRWLRVAS